MLFTSVVTIGLIASIGLLQWTAAQDPCLPTTYRLLNDSWRSTAYDGSDASFYQCDASITKRWYRPVSGAGVTMPTTAPALDKCGTQYPIWMDDVLPDTSDITSVKVCLRQVFGTCDPTWDIRVKNCSSFYVYELSQPSTCATAYCFGSESACPVGQTTDTGFTPGCGLPPNVTLNAVVTPGLNSTLGDISGIAAIIEGITFQCNVNGDVDLTTYVFDVEWYINDNKIVTYKNTPYANITESALRQSQWIDTFTLGFLVKCAVRVREVSDGPPTPYSYSTDFYAGFTTDASQYTVSEGGSIDVTIQLTVPIDCSYPVSSTPAEIENYQKNHCNLGIRVRMPTYYEDGQLRCTAGGATDEPVMFKTEECGVVFPFNDWIIPRTLQVFGSADNTVNAADSRSIYIRLQAEKGLLNPAWDFATKPDIQIVVEDQDVLIALKSCRIQTDPHIYTFDSRYISFQQVGEFIVFKHETLPIRVHAVFDWCPGGRRGTCTCGISIRNQDAVFTVNLCRGTVGPPVESGSSDTNRYIKLTACDDTHMTVTSRGNEYTVTLPSGTEITVKFGEFIHYISIKPSLVDWKSTSGICGFLDGNLTNDFRKRDGTITSNGTEFGLDWRHNAALDGNSLFSVSGDLADIPLPPLQYCRCSVDSNNPQAFTSQIMCNITSTITACTKRTSSAGYVQECDKAREKRDTHGYSYRYQRSTEEEEFDIVKIDVVLDTNYTHVEENYEWKNGWTEALAEQSCRETMNGDPMLTKCNGVLPAMTDAVDEGVNSCINDIKISGGTAFLKDTVESLKSNCLVEASRFENLTTRGSDNGNGTTFLNELFELSCPNNCSENGNCINGNCVCFTGFYGEECAMERDSIPKIMDGGMTCSTDKKSCKNFVISGSNFLDVNLTCQARRLKVYADRWEIIGASIVFPAIYLNSINCVCIIPDSVRKRRAADDVFGEGYLISISNDGINFSNETTIVTYDSACYKCDSANITCTQLESCVSTTTLATTEITSSMGQSPVTDIQTTTSLHTEHLTTLGANIGGIVAGMVFVLAIAALLMYLKTLKSKKREISLSNPDMRECPTRQRYIADVLPSRPTTASGIKFQFGDDILN